MVCLGDCRHMNCIQIANIECQAKCNFPSDIVARCGASAFGGGFFTPPATVPTPASAPTPPTLTSRFQGLGITPSASGQQVQGNIESSAMPSTSTALDFIKQNWLLFGGLGLLVLVLILRIR